MGKGITETVNEVKRAIEDIKVIVDRRKVLEKKDTNVVETVPQTISERHSQVLMLRCEKKFSFAAIAQELNLSQKEVQQEFMAAYRFTQQDMKQLL